MSPFYVFMGLSLVFGMAGIGHAGKHRPRTGPAFTCGILLGACMMSFAAIWLSLVICALERAPA